MATRQIKVLIIEPTAKLGEVWARHLERSGCRVVCVDTQPAAIATLNAFDFDVIICDVVLEDGSAFAIADLANYRQPQAKVIFVTNTTFFSDGSIFQLCSNACAYVPRGTKPDDLAAMVEHYGNAVSRDHAVGQNQAQG